MLIYLELNQLMKRRLKKLLEHKITKLPEAMKRKLNQDIETEEIMESISDRKIGKAPGIDGLTPKFYKITKKPSGSIFRYYNEWHYERRKRPGVLKSSYNNCDPKGRV